MRHIPRGLRVAEQSVTVAQYPTGLSTFETRWGDPQRSVDAAAKPKMWVRDYWLTWDPRKLGLRANGGCASRRPSI